MLMQHLIKPTKAIFSSVKPTIGRTWISSLIHGAATSNNWQDMDIISHSWSRHIRILSKVATEMTQKQSIKKKRCFAKRISMRILQQLKKNKLTQLQRDAQKYTQAFQECNWRNSNDTKHAYKSIKQFLQILQGLGVKKVWLDAICINQRSNEEKERELPLMAAFYKYSRACYVPINGFGDDGVGRTCKGSCGNVEYNNQHYNRTQGKARTFTIDSCYDSSTWENIEIPPLRCPGCGGLNNYRLPPDQDIPSLRWFTRVWTLQEFILPQNMFFIVQLDSWMEKCLGVIMAATGSHTHFCHHILKEMHDLFNYIKHYAEFEPTSLEIALSKTIKRVLLHHRQTNCGSSTASISTFCNHSKSHDDILCTALESLQKLQDSTEIMDCTECRNKPLLLRRVHHKKQPRLYCVERDALLIALGYLSHAYLNEKRDLNNEYKSNICSRYEYLLMMLRRERELNNSNNSLKKRSPYQLVGEIHNRDCEENRPEDRIIGILGLLGLIDRCNFNITATKKSPEAQYLVEVASQGVLDMEVLLELSWLDPHSGRNCPGMSWIPDLTMAALEKWNSENYEMLASSHIRRFIANTVHVSKRGPITFKTHALKGYFTKDSVSQVLVWESQHSRKLCHEELPLRLSRHPNNAHVYYTSDEEANRTTLTASVHLPLLDVKLHDHIVGFKAWLLPIFELESASSTFAVIICLEDSGLFEKFGSRLHKIGTLATVKPQLHEYWTVLPKECVSIAGFGNQLHDHINMDFVLKELGAI